MLLVIIPTYNEVSTIESLVRRIYTSFTDPDEVVDVLVIDDGSTDGTREVLRRLEGEGTCSLLPRPGKLGLGTAYREGYAYALERGYDFVVQMDADFSHDPCHLQPMLECAKSNQGLVVGSRYTRESRFEDYPISRTVMSLGANLLARAVLGISCNDLTTGFKVFSRPVLAELMQRGLSATGYEIQLETTMRASQAGFQVYEFPIVFRDRRHGTSKMSLAEVLRFGQILLRFAGASRERVRDRNPEPMR